MAEAKYMISGVSAYTWATMNSVDSKKIYAALKRGMAIETIITKYSTPSGTAITIELAAMAAVAARKKAITHDQRFRIKEEYFHKTGYGRYAVSTWEKVVDGSFKPSGRHGILMRKGRAGKPIILRTSSGEEIRYESATVAAADLHCSAALICLYCHGKTRHPQFNVRFA
jgi:hypothetical protein